LYEDGAAKRVVLGLVPEAATPGRRIDSLHLIESSAQGRDSIPAEDANLTINDVPVFVDEFEGGAVFLWVYDGVLFTLEADGAEGGPLAEEARRVIKSLLQPE
jgi:hypothetical protein